MADYPVLLTRGAQQSVNAQHHMQFRKAKILIIEDYFSPPVNLSQASHYLCIDPVSSSKIPTQDRRKSQDGKVFV